MTVVLHPCYAPNIAQFAVLAQHKVIWEKWSNFQKQSFRNRTYICTDHGKHMLTIPIKHPRKNQGHQKYSHIEIDNTYAWQRNHWRTLETAYRSSPFFEYYEDEIKELYHNKFTHLLEFNLKTISLICECLQLSFPKESTDSYETVLTSNIDGRFMASAKHKVTFYQEPYVQVFDNRNNFIPNTSIYDLLFNEGTNALPYLLAQPTSFLND